MEGTREGSRSGASGVTRDSGCDGGYDDIRGGARGGARGGPGKSGYGLSSVMSRIRLCYGDDCGLSISGGPGAGTAVTLRVKYMESGPGGPGRPCPLGGSDAPGGEGGANANRRL
jgi:hypothetical protein